VSGGRQLDGDPHAERRLDDRVLVVTGGTQGLGAAIAAAELADEGAYRAVIAACDEAARLMRRGGGGSIVNIITMASHGGEPALTAYAASKGALATLTRNAGHQLQPDRIRVNGLNIGWTATEGEHAVQTETGEPDDWLAAADRGAPLGRLLRPDDIAQMVTYLLSEAAAIVTGSVIDFDQTVHGSSGEHVPPARTGAAA